MWSIDKGYEKEWWKKVLRINVLALYIDIQYLNINIDTEDTENKSRFYQLWDFHISASVPWKFSQTELITLFFKYWESLCFKQKNDLEPWSQFPFCFQIHSFIFNRQFDCFDKSVYWAIHLGARQGYTVDWMLVHCRASHIHIFTPSFTASKLFPNFCFWMYCNSITPYTLSYIT